MQKFIAIAVLAFAVAAYAAPSGIEDEEVSMAAPDVSDETETANLKEEHQVYAKFCTESRDTVLSTIKQLTNNQAENFFNLIFGTIEEIARDALDNQAKNARTISNQIAHPETEVPEDVDGPIGEGLNKIHEGQIQPSSFFNGFMAVIKDTGSNVASAVYAKVDQLKLVAKPVLIQLAVKNTCDGVANLNSQLRGDFAEYNKAIEGKAAYLDVQCLTTHRIDKFNRFCELGKATVKPLLNIYKRSDD